MAESDDDAELSWQYLTGPNARRRSRAPAGKRALPELHLSSDCSSMRTKPIDTAHDQATSSSAETDPIPDSQMLHMLAVASKPKLVRSDTLSGMRKDRHMVDTGRMSVKDPFQDLAEQAFHRSTNLAAEGSSTGSHMSSSGGAAALSH